MNDVLKRLLRDNYGDFYDEVPLPEELEEYPEPELETSIERIVSHLRGIADELENLGRD